MEQFQLTKDILMKAKTYLPIAEKMDFISENSTKCFDRLQITHNNEQMPPMWKENAGLRARYLMAALAGLYLGQTLAFENEEHFLISEEEYDKYAGSHIIMQIERFKRDKDETIRNRAYDLLADYFELQKMFIGEIHAMIDVQNDIVVRQKILSAEAMAQLPQLLNELKALTDKKAG